MSNEEAIKHLCAIMWNIKGYNADVLREALTVAIHAVELQIPKKPDVTEWNIKRCPSCGNTHLDYDGQWNYIYCPDCGQRLE